MLTTDSAAHAFSPWLLTTLPAAGAGLSLWMARRSAGGRGLPGCGAGSGCDAVTRSRWAKWLGVPVALPAGLLYLLVLAAVATVIAMPAAGSGHAAREALLGAAPLLAAAALWFTGLQWLLLRRLCLYCLLLHAIGLAVAGTIAFGLPGGELRFAYAGLPGGEWMGVISIAAVGVAALVLGQVLVAPRTYVVRSGVSGPLSVVSGEETFVSGDKPTAQRSGASDASREVATTQGDVRSSGTTDRVEVRKIALRESVLHGDDIRGSAALRPRPVAGTGAIGSFPALQRTPTLPSPGITGEGNAGNAGVAQNPYLGRRIMTCGRIPLRGGMWPTVGLPEARHVLVFLFCYTCSNCRHLRPLLAEVMGRDPGRFALTFVPVPTHPGCNPNIRDCGAEHADACAYARLALWVWKADWSKLAQWNEFLFARGKLPGLSAAQRRAEALLGRALGDPRAAEPEADRLIGLGISLHKSTGANLTPTLLMPRNYVAGHVPTAEKLEEILEKEIGAARVAAV